jgi:LmbE family N-acetylglucosaminyl deacetylase
MKIQSLIAKLNGKLYWLKKYKYPELQNLLQHHLLSLLCPPMALSQKPAMIVAPHQDDESFGCGGLIALKREQGIPVQVVFITDGAASHTWHPQFKLGEIAPIRRQEALTALGILGVEPDQIYFLDQPDGRLKYDQAARQRATEALTRLIQTHQPGEMYVTHRHDRSADHEATYELTRQAIAASGLDIDLFQYYIWLLWKTLLFCEVKRQDLVGACQLSITSVVAKKRQAVTTYRSQYLSLYGGGTLLPPGFLNRFFLPYEVFFKS